jgi:hypothetical protein
VTVRVNIPEELYRQAKEISESQHLSVDEVISSAFDEQLAARERLKQRAAQGNRESFVRVLNKVPDVEPEDYDRI